MIYLHGALLSAELCIVGSKTIYLSDILFNQLSLLSVSNCLPWSHVPL